QILASGVSMPAALKAADLLAAEWDVAADVWSVTSWGELNRDGVAIETQKLRHPDQAAGVPYIAQALAGVGGPIIAVSDWMRAVPEQIRPWVPGTYVTLGTDGFGFSDTRPAARRYFNTDAESTVVAVLEALAHDGEIEASVPVAAADKYQINDVQAAPEQTSDPGVA
ncbi:transketolase-like TK C-terminal-containing protein, partial [Mycobacterium sp.]|uniref:transketolase-like TK C-terminal-containing protein n=1 Tax=Mycobacterium sp. TaxID=1785 RepID=UPI003C7843BB